MDVELCDLNGACANNIVSSPLSFRWNTGSMEERREVGVSVTADEPLASVSASLRGAFTLNCKK